MMWSSSRCGWWGVAVVILCWVAPALVWAAPPKRAPDQARSHEAEELKGRYRKLISEGKYAESAVVVEKACSILEEELGRWSVEYAECLNDVGALSKAKGEYGKAEPLLERALAIFEEVQGPEHPDVARSLSNLAGLYMEQGEYGKAEPLLERALAIFEEVHGSEHPDVALGLSNLAMLRLYQGEYDRAEPLLERALAIKKKVLGPEHPDVATSLNNLAGLYHYQGEYGKAEPMFERALVIKEKVLGPDHADIATSLNNLAGLYGEQGEYGKAEPMLERALAIREKALGPDHPSVATSLNNLAMLYFEQGEYGKAEPMLERALVIRDKGLGPAHPLVASSLNNLAMLYLHQGEYDKAEPLYERTLAIRENTLGPAHPAIAWSLGSLAVLYRCQGEHGKAERLLERALAILGKTLGSDHSSVATSLNNLAMLYFEQGEYGKAEPLFERALAIREKVLGPDHPSVATSLNHLAELYNEQGEYGRAEPLLERALAIGEKALGPNHLHVAITLNNLARLHLELGRYDSAVNLRGRALDIEHENLGRTLLFAEEHRRLDYAATMSGSFDDALSAHLQAAPDHPPSAELALTTLLRRKGLVLDLGARSAATIRRTLPEEHQHLLDELSSTRNRYTALRNRGPGRLTIERFAEQLAELQQEQHRLWREIADHSPIVDTLSKPVTIADIQQALPSKGVLVEYIRYFPKYHEKAPSTPAAPRYAAYLVFPDRFDWVDLGLAETIHDEAHTFRQALMQKTAISSAMYGRIMVPVLERIGEADALFIAPDAALNLIPFAALYDGEHYLIERYPLYTLTTGRDLLHPWDTGATAGQSVVVVANPTGARLPGTEREATLLGELLPKVKILLREAATESEAQRQTQPWLMHLATHGFFEVPERDLALEAAMAEHQELMSPSAMPFAGKPADNPMMHAGLVLAPDPDAAGDNGTTSDGRLTAYEISGWDLRGTELVVLSACGTGLGEVEAGEGVFGLRRAFAMAGAQTQVMSLWNAGDNTTTKLMNAYYRKLLAGKGRGEAMREVQLEMLHSSEHHLPGDWASFVVVGEWKPLSAERLPKVEGPPTVQPKHHGCHVAVDSEPPPTLHLLVLLCLLRRQRRDSHGSTESREPRTKKKSAPLRPIP